MSQRALGLSIATLLLAAGSLAGCGGDGNGGGSGVVEGPITGFGSVIVNGIRFDVSDASLTADGQRITEDQLEVGMVVRVRGEIDDDGVTGRALAVEYDDDLQGPVVNIDRPNNRFEIFGQAVQVNTATAFRGVTFETLAESNVVEVSGFVDADGLLHASFVRLAEPDDDDYELKGFVSALDTAAETFMIGNQLVDYSAADMDDFPAGGIANGQLVEVEFDRASYNANPTVIAADEVEYASRFGASAGDILELEGYINEFASANDFRINNQRVRTSSATRYEDGASAAQLGPNVRLEVRGRLAADGVLDATHIEIEDDSNLEIEAAVEAIAPDERTLTLLGLPVRIVESTQFEADDDRFFSFERVNIGDWLGIDGYLATDGSFVATRVERDDDDGDNVHLQGPVTSIQSPDFTLFGTVTVTTTTGTEFEGRDDDDLTQAQFFGQLAENDIVSVEGIWNGAAISASEVEVEDDD